MSQDDAIVNTTSKPFQYVRRSRPSASIARYANKSHWSSIDSLNKLNTMIARFLFDGLGLQSLLRCCGVAIVQFECLQCQHNMCLKLPLRGILALMTFGRRT